METQGRRIANWLDSFETYLEAAGTPPIFAKWAGISAVAGALERKIWVHTRGSNLYPNLYVVLVAPPGVGKTVALAESDRLLREMPNHHVAPSSVTKASLIDSLNDARRSLILPGQPYIEFHALYVVALEFGVLVPGYDSEFMNALTSIYDGHPYAERRRTKDLKVNIPAPQINMVGATTPSYLSGFMPEGAWDQGFISRTLLVYAGQQPKRSLFGGVERRPGLYSDLLHDLKIIGSLYGKYGFEPDAAAAIEEWHSNDGPPTPDHPRLRHYLTRRTAHLLKLCMISAVIDSQAPIITLAHYQRALDWLLEIEAAIPDIFRSMNSGGDTAAMEEVWHFVYQSFVKEKKPIAEHRIMAFLSERVPSHNVYNIIKVMVASKMILPEIAQGVTVYKPAPKTAF